MSTSFIPIRDADMNLWAVNFSALITATPDIYKLLPDDAIIIQNAVNDFAAKLLAASNPSTRTGTTILAKDSAKAAMLTIVRNYARQIKNTLGISDVLKQGLGIVIDDLVPSPVPAPTTQPLLNILSATPLQHTLRYADAATPDKRSKPAGAVGLQVFCHIGDNPPDDPATWMFVFFVTRQPFVVDFTMGDVGKKARYMARWQTRTGLTGPWSGNVEMTVAA